MNSRRVKLLDATSQQCRWLDGKINGEVAICGLPIHNRTSWCEKHHSQVFTKNSKRAKARFALLAKSAGYPSKG